MKPITVPTSQAGEVRALLRRRWGDGILFTERRQWFIFARFDITGPPEALAAAERDFVKWQSDRMCDEAW